MTALPTDGQVQWQASIRRADGSIERRRFWLSPDCEEPDARYRAWQIWTLAKAGSDGSFLNPTLHVELVEEAISAMEELATASETSVPPRRAA